MNTSEVVSLALDTLLMDHLFKGDQFPMVRFTYPHAKLAAQTLNRELDRNKVRCDLVAQGANLVRRTLGEEECATMFGHVAWTPSIAKSVVADEWIMTAGIAGVFATSREGTRSTAIGRYAKQGFGHPRIYWHAADGMATATLPAAL